MSSADPGPGVWLKAALMCLAAAMSAARAADAPGMPDFEAGVASYRSGDYAQALAAFLAARAAGLDIANLHVDLGLTYYKLGRYAEARAAFERLRGYAGYAATADFHIGLIAAREGDAARASALWSAVTQDPDPDMRQRAEVALGRLDAGRAPPGAAGYVLAALGQDSNPALLDEDVQGLDAASASAELFGAFDYPLGGAAATATVLHGGAFVRDYAEDNGLDQRGLFAGVSRERGRAQRRTAVSLDAAATYLDGEAFTRTFTLGAQAGPALRAGGGGVRGQVSRITARAPYAHLDGWRLRAAAEWTTPPGRAQARLGYQFEYNDRADFVSGNEFFSHSPLRHRLDLVVNHPAGAQWALRWSARYRASRYGEPYRFVEGGQVREERRTEELVQAGLQGRRRLGTTTFWLLEYQYSRNDSTFAVFDYDRHVALVGLEWLPNSP